jgi:hypothetical protein
MGRTPRVLSLQCLPTSDRIDVPGMPRLAKFRHCGAAAIGTHVGICYSFDRRGGPVGEEETSTSFAQATGRDLFLRAPWRCQGVSSCSVPPGTCDSPARSRRRGFSLLDGAPPRLTHETGSQVSLRPANVRGDVASVGAAVIRNTQPLPLLGSVPRCLGQFAHLNDRRRYAAMQSWLAALLPRLLGLRRRGRA